MLTRKRFSTSSALTAPALLLVGTYVGCFPDLDALSAGDDETESGGGRGEGGTRRKTSLNKNLAHEQSCGAESETRHPNRQA